MKELLASWEKLCVSSASLRFVDINLRGTGQVMLQDNPLSGALFLAAIVWGSYAAGAPRIAIGGIVALLAATLTAYWVRADKKSLAEGLYGFNGILVGLALATFLAPGPLLWAYVILGGAVSTIVMMWTVKLVTPWGAALTFPFVITTWLLLLATYGFSGLTGAALPTGKVVGAFQAVASDPLRFSDFVARYVAQHFASVFERERSVCAAVAGRIGGQFACSRCICACGRNTGRNCRASSRRRKRFDHRRAAGLQSGADRHRARHRLLPAELSGRLVYCAGYGDDGRRASGAECRAGAIRHSSTDRTICAGHLDVYGAA